MKKAGIETGFTHTLKEFINLSEKFLYRHIYLMRFFKLDKMSGFFDHK
jgi:hypothetical protein